MSDRTCSIDGCERQRVARGWCKLHHRRWLTYGDPTFILVERRLAPTDGLCVVQDCTQPHLARGWCRTHYLRWWKHGSPEARYSLIGQWQKDEVSYSGAHHRIYQARGSASQFSCGQCKQRADEWAYDHECPDQRADETSGLPYSLNPERYAPMCRPCHRQFDLDWSRAGRL